MLFLQHLIWAIVVDQTFDERDLQIELARQLVNGRIGTEFFLIADQDHMSIFQLILRKKMQIFTQKSKNT